MDIGLNKRKLPCRDAALSVMVKCYEAGHSEVGKTTFRNWLTKEVAAMFGENRTVRIGHRRW